MKQSGYEYSLFSVKACGVIRTRWWSYDILTEWRARDPRLSHLIRWISNWLCTGSFSIALTAPNGIRSD